MDSSVAAEDDVDNAIMAIRRNGVALKGQCVTLLNVDGEAAGATSPST